MILDADLEFSNEQAITATANSTNVVDSAVVTDLGVNEPLYIVLTVTETFADSGSDSTVAVTLVTDDNAALSSTATVEAMVTFAALSAAGTQYTFKLPFETSVAYQRYLALTYTLANGNLSAGKISAHMTTTPQKFDAYASGYSITTS